MTATEREVRNTVLTRLRHLTSAPPKDENIKDQISKPSLRVSPLQSPATKDPSSGIVSLSNEFTRLGGEFQSVPSKDAIAPAILRLIRESGYQRMAISDDPILADGLLQSQLRSSGIVESLMTAADGLDPVQLRTALAQCQLGITGCEAVLVDTATLVMKHAAFGGRSISLLPECHLVVATSSQLYETLDDWMERCDPGSAFPSCSTFITGPSRTADIEKILITGVHGPLRLVLVLIQ